MELQEKFQQAVDDSKLLTTAPDDETELKLYALQQQATEGNAKEEDAPLNPLNFIEKAKFKAWSVLNGKSKIDAMKDYISLVQSLK